MVNTSKGKAEHAQKGLLKAKIRKARKTPKFRRQEIHAQKTLKDTWRKPKGRHSKLRKQEKGRGRLPKPGYGTPASLKGLDSHGFLRVRVSNVKETEKLDPKKEKAVIASAVGRKKRLEILKKAEEMGIAVSNA